MRSGTITRAFSSAIRTAIPADSLTVSQWAEVYRYVSAERSTRYGKWRNDLAPYLVEVMDAVGQPGVREVVFVKSSQIAGTEFLNNVLGFFMHADPSSILFVAENEDKGRAWSKECLSPMIRDTPALAAIVRHNRERDSGNTIEGKSFPGGHLAIAWATSPATLSSRPRRVVLMDERDAFLPTREGDPARLAEKRTTTYPDAVIVKVSTPRDRLELEPGAPPDSRRYSPIELEYENSDQRKYFVPCPHCQTFQTLEWSRVKWDDDPKGAYYVCVEGCVIEHAEKAEMLARGEWRALAPFSGRAGFFINESYSPFVTWGEMAANFLEAKKSRATLKVFVNTSLAEGWEEQDAAIQTDDLTARREEYEAEVPRGVLVVVAGVDVQGNRLEVEIVGYGLDEESWSLDYQIIAGDPAKPAVWDELKTLLTTPLFDEEGREHYVSAAAIDSGGHHTQEVYRFCRENAARRFYAVKGSSASGQPLAPRRPTLQGKPPVNLYRVGTETAKDTLAAHLRVEQPGPGFCHFPVWRDDSYFKQLRSEHPVTRYERGVSVRQWRKLKASARNEALDCRVYAMAALAILRPNLRAYQRRLDEWHARAEDAAREEATSTPPQQTPRKSGDTTSARRGGGGGWVNGWRL